MIELTVTGRDGDGERSGYWIVMGPQAPNVAYATVERTRLIARADDGENERETRLVFAWVLYRRSELDQRETRVTRMEQAADGQGKTLDEALQALREAWPTHLDDA